MPGRYFVQAAGALLALLLMSFASYAQVESHPFEVGGFVTVIDLQDSVREKPLGLGGRVGYHLTDNFALDGEVSYFPENSGNNFGQTVVLAGLKAGVRNENFGVFAKVRPGVVHFGGDAFVAVNNGSRTNFAVDVGGVLEYYPSPRVIVRVDFGDTIVPFGDETINQPVPPFIFRPGTTHNFQGSFGVGFRF